MSDISSEHEVRIVAGAVLGALAFGYYCGKKAANNEHGDFIRRESIRQGCVAGAFFGAAVGLAPAFALVYAGGVAIYYTLDWATK